MIQPSALSHEYDEGGPDRTVNRLPNAGAVHERIVLSVVVPTLNEYENVGELVARLNRTLADIAHEIIFVDDNSADRTWSAAKALAAQDRRIRCIRRVGRRGLSGACIEGVLSSSAPYVVIMDGDLQHDERCIPAMLELLMADKADLVVATRYTENASGAALGRMRGRISGLSTVLAERLFRTRVSDPLSGFFAIRRDRFESLAPRLSPVGFKILLDILISARGSLRTAEQPYTFRRRFAGASKLDLQVGLDFVGLLFAKATGDLVGPRFITFSLVGAAGLLVHLVSLRFALAVLALPFPPAQGLASLIAMTSNFFVNNAFTYRDCRLKGFALLRGFIAFCAICAVGVLANIGTADWLYTGHVTWWGAGLAGALMGAVWNYLLTRDLVWRPAS
jgi:dolichol-phosphate mannosyltransferase